MSVNTSTNVKLDDADVDANFFTGTFVITETPVARSDSEESR
jgi:hypothetical protein